MQRNCKVTVCEEHVPSLTRCARNTRMLMGTGLVLGSVAQEYNRETNSWSILSGNSVTVLSCVSSDRTLQLSGGNKKANHLQFHSLTTGAQC